MWWELTHRKEKKKEKTNKQQNLPIHILLHVVAGYCVLVFVGLFVCFLVCSFWYGITLCHIAHCYIASITTAICLTEMEFNSITFDVFFFFSLLKRSDTKTECDFVLLLLWNNLLFGMLTATRINYQKNNDICTNEWKTIESELKK